MSGVTSALSQLSEPVSCPQSTTREQDIGGCVERWYIRIINIRIEPVAAPRGSTPALNNILVSKATAIIFLYTTYKFSVNRIVTNRRRQWRPHDLSRAPDSTVIGFDGRGGITGPCLYMMHGSRTPNASQLYAAHERYIITSYNYFL